MWLAHFTFHLFTAALTPIPVAERVAKISGSATLNRLVHQFPGFLRSSRA
jgi:hypothetical protein